MKKRLVLTGKILSGAQEAAYFTNLPWVQEQCQRKFGFEPYPGTLNVEIFKNDVPSIIELQKEEGLELESPDPNFCSAKVLHVQIESLECVIIIPPDEVNIHAKNILEIMAPVRIKEALSVDDGDSLTLVIPEV